MKKGLVSGRDLLLGVTLILAVLAAYLPALRAGYVWDDDAHVTDNDALRSADGLRRIWVQRGATHQYYPLVFSTFWLEFQAWGPWPLGYHLVNVLLHAGNALLVWRALRLLGVPGAWLAAGIFALHPVQVESVAWITERKNVLSGALYLAALIAWLRFWPADPQGLATARRWRWYAAALLLFFGALLSKTVACSLPAALVLLLWWKDRLAWRAVAWLAPFFALGLAMGLHTAWIEVHQIGARGDDWSLSWLERFLIAGRAVWFYAGKLVAPVELTFVYPRWSVRADSAWQYLFPVAALACLAGLWLGRARLGRGPLVAALYFGGTLVPALGFFDVYPMRFTFVADHYQYLASLGLISLLAAVAATPWERWKRRGTRMPWGSVLACCLLLVLGALSWRQARSYRDAETLWRDTLSKDPGSWIAHNNLGLILYQRGSLEEALRHYSRALDQHPGYAEAHYNAGLVLRQQGRLAEALEHLLAAARLRPDHPDAQLNLGLVLARLDRLAEAEERLLSAAKLRPEHPDTHLNLGVVLARQGRMAEAVKHFTEAVRLDPGSQHAHYDLGLALAQLGDLEEAARHFAASVRLDPALAEAHRELGWIRARQGDWAAAVRSFLAAVESRPADAGLLLGLSLALEQEGRGEDAAAQLLRAKQVDPNWPAAATQLAWLLATHPDARMRNGSFALRLAREASQASAGPTPTVLDALAAAQAETGAYEEAASTARQALSAARSTMLVEMAEEIARRVRLYEARLPYHQESAAASPGGG